MFFASFPWDKLVPWSWAIALAGIAALLFAILFRNLRTTPDQQKSAKDEIVYHLFRDCGFLLITAGIGILAVDSATSQIESAERADFKTEISDIIQHTEPAAAKNLITLKKDQVAVIDSVNSLSREVKDNLRVITDEQNAKIVALSQDYAKLQATSKSDAFLVDQLTLRAGSSMANMLWEFILNRPFYYKTVEVVGNFVNPQESDPNQGCINGEVSFRVQVCNRTSVSHPYTAKCMFTDMADVCPIINIKQMCIYRDSQVVECRDKDQIAAELFTAYKVVKFEKILDIPPSECLTIETKTIATFKKSDYLVHRVRYPTEQMSVELTLPSELSINDISYFHPADELSGAGSRGKWISTRNSLGTNSNKAVLKGGVLPYGAIEFRWSERP